MASSSMDLSSYEFEDDSYTASENIPLNVLRDRIHRNSSAESRSVSASINCDVSDSESHFSHFNQSDVQRAEQNLLQAYNSENGNDVGILSDFDSESDGSDIPSEIADWERENDNADDDIEVDNADVDPNGLRPNEIPFHVFASLEDYNPTWVTNYTEVHVSPCIEEQGALLPNGWDTETAKFIDYFQLFVTDEFLEEIVTHTNNYAIFCRDEKRRKDRNPLWVDKNWTPVTLSELKCYLGISLLFGVTPARNYSDYWSSNKFLRNEGISGCMSCKRFEKIKQYFHTSDRSTEPKPGDANYDILYKVRPVISQMEKTFEKYYRPSHKLSLDEGVIATKSRTSLRIYLPSKPKKFGVKAFLLACESGYLLKFEIYKGKANAATPSVFGANFDLVDGMVRHLYYKNYKLFTDNYYSSIYLAKHLLQHGMYYTATIRKNRKLLPPKLNESNKSLKSKMNRGDFISFQAQGDQVTTTLWRDTKIVRFVSTMNTASKSVNISRNSRRGPVVIKSPSVGVNYNAAYFFVDKFDQLSSNYAFGRRSNKYWRYIFNWLMNSAVVNAWILYYEKSTVVHRKKRFAAFDFRLGLAEELIGNSTSRTRVQQQALRQPEPDHRHVRMGGGKIKNCYKHSVYKPDGKIRKQTVYGCRLCGVHFCLDCHHRFHNPNLNT